MAASKSASVFSLPESNVWITAKGQTWFADSSRPLKAEKGHHWVNLTGAGDVRASSGLALLATVIADIRRLAVRARSGRYPRVFASSL
jgi:hypothetical protein